MALDEPTEKDDKFAQDGYTIVIDPSVTETVGAITIEKHQFGGLYFAAGNGR